MIDTLTENTLAGPTTSLDELPPRKALCEIIEMLGFDPREINMLGFEMVDDGMASTT